MVWRNGGSHSHFLKPLIETASVFLLSPAQNKVWSQLRISGLFPSAYWFGQALVDIPLYWLMFLLMYFLELILGPKDSIFQIVNQVMHVS